MFVFPTQFWIQYLQLIVGERSPAYHLKAQVYITVLIQSNSFVAAEGEIRPSEIFFLLKSSKGPVCVLRLCRKHWEERVAMALKCSGLSMRNLHEELESC